MSRINVMYDVEVPIKQCQFHTLSSHSEYDTKNI